MSKKYLVAVDGSEQGWKALQSAAELANATDAALEILHVVPVERTPEGMEQWARVEGIALQEMDSRLHAARALGDNITSEAEKRARSAGLTDITTRALEGHAAETITNHAKEIGADLLIVGSRGLGNVKGFLLGSISQKVSHLAPCDCMLVK